MTLQRTVQVISPVLFPGLLVNAGFGFTGWLPLMASGHRMGRPVFSPGPSARATFERGRSSPRFRSYGH